MGGFEATHRIVKIGPVREAIFKFAQQTKFNIWFQKLKFCDSIVHDLGSILSLLK